MQQKDEIFNYEPLWGSWYIDELLGSGAFGNVYKISKEVMGTKYYSAVKIISIPRNEDLKDFSSNNGLDDADSINEYFQDLVNFIINEVNILYSLKGNSNIISYEDRMINKKPTGVGWDIIIRMEFSNSLSRFLMNNSITGNEIIKLGIDILAALSLCQKNRIIHRDIKEDNIFISDNGNYKLGDFGVSKSLLNTSRAATRVGTLGYMAPEVYNGENYNITSDIYSLGIVLYKLSNHGRIPFLPEYPYKFKAIDLENAQIKRFSGVEFSSPDNCDQELSRIILKACAFKPKDRYQSPDEMIKDLKLLLNSENFYNMSSVSNRNQETVPIINNLRKHQLSKLDKTEAIGFQYSVVNDNKSIQNSINDNRIIKPSFFKQLSTNINTKKYLLIASITIGIICLSIIALSQMFVNNENKESLKNVPNKTNNPENQYSNSKNELSSFEIMENKTFNKNELSILGVCFQYGIVLEQDRIFGERFNDGFKFKNNKKNKVFTFNAALNSGTAKIRLLDGDTGTTIFDYTLVADRIEKINIDISKYDSLELKYRKSDSCKKIIIADPSLIKNENQSTKIIVTDIQPKEKFENSDFMNFFDLGSFTEKTVNQDKLKIGTKSFKYGLIRNRGAITTRIIKAAGPSTFSDDLDPIRLVNLNTKFKKLSFKVGVNKGTAKLAISDKAKNVSLKEFNLKAGTLQTIDVDITQYSDLAICVYDISDDFTNAIVAEPQLSR